MYEENKTPVTVEEEVSKSKKIWKNAGFVALAVVLALITVTVVCL